MALHDENVVWHAHPVTPQQREQRHGHRGVVLWFTGLSGSGKSTVAGALEEALHKLGVSTYLLDGFIEVFVDTPLATCEARDPKGLYKKARAGELRNFTGIDSVYEAPESPEIHLDGEQLVTNLVPQLLDLLRQEDIIRS